MPQVSLSLPLKEDRCATCKKIRSTWCLIDSLLCQALPRLFALDHHLKAHSVMLGDSLKWWDFDRQKQLTPAMAICCCSKLCCISDSRTGWALTVALGFLFPLIPASPLPAYSHRSWDASAIERSYKMSCAPENTSLKYFSLCRWICCLKLPLFIHHYVFFPLKGWKPDHAVCKTSESIVMVKKKRCSIDKKR